MPAPHNPPPRPILPAAAVRSLQSDLNYFVRRFNLKGLEPIIVDGELGPGTRRRVRQIKHLLGFGKGHRGANVRTLMPGTYFRWRLEHPRHVRMRAGRRIASDVQHVAAGMRRRRRHRAEYRRNRRKALKSGVGTFDGRPVAAWLIPYLAWARRNGWRGRLNSGYRTPEYSESLCMNICGRPSCPGRCAGRASGHSQKDKPHGCIDVSDPETFGALMARCPLEPRLRNALGAADPWHYSVSGR